MKKYKNDLRETVSRFEMELLDEIQPGEAKNYTAE